MAPDLTKDELDALIEIADRPAKYDPDKKLLAKVLLKVIWALEEEDSYLAEQREQA